MTKPVDTSVYTNLDGLAALKRDARAQDPSALRETAKQFESIFAKMVLSSMRQASSSVGDSLMGSSQGDFYQGMFDDQLAVELTKGKGLGLADMLVRQLSQSGMVPKDSAASATGESTAQKSGLPITPASSADTNKKSVATAPTQEEFINELWPCAQEAGAELGVDPRHLLAQAALETGWGKSLPCDAQGNTSNNLFGIKAGSNWNGDSVSVKTLEFEGGVPVPKQAKFKAYDSPQDSFRDYVALLRDNPRYAGALNTGSDANAFATALQRGGYATDPAYAQKIAAIAQNLGANAPTAHNLPISETALKSSTSAPITTQIATR